MRGMGSSRFGSRSVLGFVCAFAFFALAGSASAVSVDSADDSFTIDFGGNVEGANVAGLSASAFVDVVSISGSTLVLDITLTNTSSVLWETSRVSAFGFNTDPSIASALLDSDVFANVNLGERFPNGFGSVDLCVINNRNNCTGGRSGGLMIGESEQFRLTLNFGSSISAVELDNFGVRYQSLSSDALGFSGDSGTGTPTTPNSPIPEPGSVVMFLLGGLIVAGLARKQVLTARA